jgi:hypothetical protein
MTLQPPAGWYPDPSGPQGSLRYWDGLAWTEHTLGYPIEIRVKEPESYLKFLQVAYAETQGFNPQRVDGSRWPVVIAVNRLGHERQLLECETKKKAAAEFERIRADLEILGLRDWCERYGVPWSFVTS